MRYNIVQFIISLLYQYESILQLRIIIFEG